METQTGQLRAVYLAGLILSAGLLIGAPLGQPAETCHPAQIYRFKISLRQRVGFQVLRRNEWSVG